MILGKRLHRQYHPEDYDDLYYSSLENGLHANPVSLIHCQDLISVLFGNSILSIGCGTGFMEAEIKQRMPWVQIEGTEFVFPSTLVDLWRDRQLRVTLADATAQPFGSSTFDSCYTSHVLEHVPDPRAVILESIRVSRYVAAHLVPINLKNPDHIHFFKFDGHDNKYRTQRADIDLKKLASEIVTRLRQFHPRIEYRMQISCPRDGSRSYGELEFPIKRKDRPDGLMPCFLLTFYKAGYITDKA